MRRQFVIVNRLLDREHNYEDEKSLVEYGGFFANPEIYAKIKETETSTVKDESFDKTAKELKRKAMAEAAKDAAEKADLEIVVPDAEPGPNQ